MNTLSKFINTLPLLPRLLLLFFVGILLFALAKRIGSFVHDTPWLMLLAILIWTAVILGALHANGYLGAASRWPVLGPGLDWLTSGANGMNLRNNGASDAGKVNGHSPEECRHAANESMQELRGIDTVIQQLDKCRTNLRSNRPGVVLWLTGPRGTGKSTLANSLGCYLCGHGAIVNDRIYRFAWHDLRGGDGLSRLTEQALNSLGGILLLDDADWLVEPGDQGIEAGAALGQIANDYPGRLTLVVTCKPDIPERLYNDEQHRQRWIDRFAQHNISFPDLSDDTLVKLIHNMSIGVGLEIENGDAANQTLHRWLREKRKRDGFANAITAQEIVEYIMRDNRVAQTSPKRVDAEHLRLIIADAVGWRV